MTYHLSKRDEKWLSTFISTLIQAKETTLLEASDPKRLLYVLRQAAASETFSWLRDKFILKLQPDGVLCKIRRPEVKLPEKPKDDLGILIHEDTDLLGIVNLLVQQKPSLVTFLSASTVGSDDLVRLNTYCEVNDYDVIKDPKSKAITIKKKNA